MVAVAKAHLLDLVRDLLGACCGEFRCVSVLLWRFFGFRRLPRVRVLVRSLGGAPAYWKTRFFCGARLVSVLSARPYGKSQWFRERTGLERDGVRADHLLERRGLDCVCVCVTLLLGISHRFCSVRV